MSTMIRLHAVGSTISHEDLACFGDIHGRRECTAHRRPGSFWDSKTAWRIYVEVHGGKDIGPCGHHAAIEEGDSVTLGEDSYGPTTAISALFPWRYQTVVLTNELVYEIVKVGHLRGSGKYHDRKVINWLSRHVGDEVFCVHW